MSTRYVAIELTADVEDVVRNMRRASEQIKALINHPLPGVGAMRRIGEREGVNANLWLQTHIDDMYAQLGIERDPHLIRGDS